MKKTATEYWKERFGEDPQTDSEKLAVAMMSEYCNDVFKNEISDGLDSGFTEEQKKQHLNHALATCAKVLTATAVLIGAHKHVEGDVVYPDGSIWHISFKEKE